MKQTVDAVVEAGLRERVKIIIGGAPVTDAFANRIGADGYAETAGDAAGIAQDLMIASQKSVPDESSPPGYPD